MSAALPAADAWRRRLTIPSYQVAEAARYAGISAGTINKWQDGGATVSHRDRGAELSYLQLIEVAVVAAMRAATIKLPVIRATRDYLKNKYKSEFPFATHRFKHDGKQLYLYDKEIPGLRRAKGHLVETASGQLVWPSIIQRLKEFEYDHEKIVVRWRVAGAGSPVLIDPRISYGAPNVRGIATWVLRGRWEAGEEMREIAGDFGIRESDVLAALKFEGIDPNAPRPDKWLH